MPILLLLLIFSTPLLSQTIEEKKESLRQEQNDLDERLDKELQEINSRLIVLKEELASSFDEAKKLLQENAEEGAFKALLERISKTKSEIAEVEKEWQELASIDIVEEEHALWHQPESTLGHLISDYGLSFVYLVPQELAATPISVSSRLPVPVQSWDEMLDEIIRAQGLGIRQLNPYLKQVFGPTENSINTLSLITNDEKDLDFIPGVAKACYILTTVHNDPQEVFQFLGKFSNPERIRLTMIGREVFIIGEVQEIKQLLKMHSFIHNRLALQEYKLLPLSKIPAQEAEKILLTYFSSDGKTSPLKALPLQNGHASLFIVGSPEQIKEAEGIINDIESKMQNPKEKHLFCYQCKHAKADEIAAVLEKVYAVMQEMPLHAGEEAKNSPPVVEEEPKEEQNLVISPSPVSPLASDGKKQSRKESGFIVDSKGGCIIMVVEKEALCKFKELLKRLDVPKKMVQIEVLLFEKRVSEEDHFGLNLLKIGNSASNETQTSLSWKDPQNANPGILSFLLSRKACHGLPSFDLAYNFLLAQDDVQINACPSVTTINQTPAKIALVEEISVNNGTVIETDSSILKDSFSRAQYGITIEITPTIHQEEEESSTRFITLETDITFDTTKPSKVARPDVTRRNVKNQVRIADGQTVVIGGLRRKSNHDSLEKIPFLGELPGIGRFFSESNLSENQTEMFIFLTPKIIDDTDTSLERWAEEELTRRPGDIPELLECIQEAKMCEKKKLFESSLKMLLGRESA